MILLLIDTMLVIVKNFSGVVREKVCEEMTFFFGLLMWHVGS